MTGATASGASASGDSTQSAASGESSALPLPTLDELLEGLRVVSLPMNTRFRGITTREAALFPAPNGWVEFSPFLEYETAEASTWLAAAVDDGWGARPPLLRDEVPVNATVPAVAADEVRTVLGRFGDPAKLHTIKVKVAEDGQTLEDDRERLDAVRALVGDNVRIRVDANGHWGLDEAYAALTRLSVFRLEYAEQPVADVEDLARLRERLQNDDVFVPLAADESIRKASDPLRVAELGAADIIVIKAQPLGGVPRALDVVARSGLPAVVSSALDTAIGIGLGARLAASLPTLDHACGLGTGAFFSEDVAGYRPDAGRIQPVQVVPDLDALEHLDAGVARTGWWRERIAAAHAVLADQPR